MLDEVFAESVAHKPAPWLRSRFSSLVTRHSSLGWSGHSILRRRLRPFTFWAAANLDFIKSPFAGNVPKTGTISFPDLYLATEACRLRWPHTFQLNRIDFEYRAWFYGRRFARDTKYRFEQIRAFIAYLRDYSTSPEYVTGDGAQPVKLPWYLYHAAMLVKHAGFTQSQAWETEVSFGQWWVTALLTSAGNNIDIVTPEDRKDLAEMEQETQNRNQKVESRNRNGQ